MPSNLENVRLGVCTLTYDGADLGFTKGGVQVEVTTETYTVTVDQFGTTPISDYIIGRQVQVTTPLVETTLENMVAIMPGATLVVDGTDSDVKKVTVTSGVGHNLIESAKELALRPVGNTDASEDFVIPLANTPGQMSWSYETNAERIFNCVWNAYPDIDQGNILFIYGDKAAVAA